MRTAKCRYGSGCNLQQNGSRLIPSLSSQPQLGDKGFVPDRKSAGDRSRTCPNPKGEDRSGSIKSRMELERPRPGWHRDTR
jgi:hypothetical protein